MPRHISEPRFDGTLIGLQAAISRLVREVNDALDSAATRTGERIGREGQVTLSGDLDAASKRLTNIARSQRGTDAINRDEAQSLIQKRLHSTITPLQDLSAGRNNERLIVKVEDNVGNAELASTRNAIATLTAKMNELITHFGKE